MNNYILISRTYSETTPESVEDCDFSDKGFIEEREPVTFSQLVDLMKEHREASMSPNPYNTDVWYQSSAYIKNWAKGIDRIEYIHYHLDNTPNAAKYWKWARMIADGMYPLLCGGI